MMRQLQKREVTMPGIYDDLLQGKKNIVLIGEAGCGKSETALNIAVQLAKDQQKPVHFFDLDQTKPIYRSRDAQAMLDEHGIWLHYEMQFFDSPTVVGGVAECLNDPSLTAVLDVGGGEAGARMIGRFARHINAGNTIVFYIVNPYRPWSRDLLAIDETLSAILQVSHIKVFSILANPNLGAHTTAEEFRTGLQKTREMLGGAIQVEGACACEAIYTEVKDSAGMPVIPLRLYLKYEWIDE